MFLKACGLVSSNIPTPVGNAKAADGSAKANRPPATSARTRPLRPSALLPYFPLTAISPGALPLISGSKKRHFPLHSLSPKDCPCSNKYN